MHEIVFLRAAERLLAVVIGGICVYLGYQLFIRIPAREEGQAELKFPGGVSVYLARVGPGVFFALFGAAIVSLSLYKGIQFNEGPSSYIGVSATGQASDTHTRDATRHLLRGEIAILNTIPENLRQDLPEGQRYRLTEAIRRTKVALMESVWAPDWGDPIAFKRWVQNRELDPVPDDLRKAAEYFRYAGDAK